MERKRFGFKFLLITILCSLFLTNALVFDTASASIESKHRETKAKIKKLKILENMETNKLYKNQQRLETTSKDLEYSKKQYDYTKNKLSSTEDQLDSAISQYNQNLYYVRKRIRTIFQHQRKNLFEMILTSTDINTMLDNIYYQNIITRTDKIALSRCRQNARKIAQIKYQQEMQRRQLAISIKDINYKQQSLQKAIDKNENMIQRLRTDRMAYEKAERELARQSANLGSMISRTSTSRMKVAGGFVKPVSGYISSPYGWRIHPIFKSRTFHSGVDIAGRYGSPIAASNSGRVTYVGWYGGYGKVVIIDHGVYNGGNISTLYAHLSSCAVGVGQHVSRGQTVAYEGSTGYSTGPHLHFEVRVDGQTRNPLNYI